MAAPVLSLGALAASGGTFAAGTYFWVVTAVNGKGETVASNEVSATVAANGTQALTWAAISGATSYKVYRGNSTGNETALVGNPTGTSFTDTGSAGTAAAVPNVNSAAVGKVFYVWALAEPVSALAGKPIKVPASGLVIE
jgi:hypothetical protein